MWLQAEYLPASLFTLKLSLATSSGARSLLVPTPFAIKTALVDALLRTNAGGSPEALTRALAGSTVALRPSARATITNLFARVLKPRREDGGSSGGDRGAESEGETESESGSATGPYGKTIAYREYVHLDGALGVAIETGDPALAESLSWLLAQVNYFGRRGSFFQLSARPTLAADLPAGFIPIGVPQQRFAADGLIQMLDDWGPEMTFDKLDIYSSGRIRLGRERVLHSAVLPYRRVRSSRSFTEYELIPA